MVVIAAYVILVLDRYVPVVDPMLTNQPKSSLYSYTYVSSWPYQQLLIEFQWLRAIAIIVVEGLRYHNPIYLQRFKTNYTS